MNLLNEYMSWLVVYVNAASDLENRGFRVILKGDLRRMDGLLAHIELGR